MLLRTRLGRTTIYQLPNQYPIPAPNSQLTTGNISTLATLILAKGRYAGTSDEEIFRDRVTDGEWKAAIRPVPPRKTTGAWLLTLTRGTEQVEIPVSDFASVAAADDVENRFSIWF